LLYLYLLKQDQAPTQELMQSTLEHYQKSRGGDVQMLGGQKVNGALPSDPDMFVVVTCLSACKAHNIDFNTDSDQIAYSIDNAGGKKIGVCQIQVK
jgi:hypothetical protein